MRVQVVPRLGALAKAWDELVERQEVPSPFLASWWLDHAAGGEPAIVCCFDGDELVGGAAFELDRMGRGPLGLDRVRCLGHGPLAPDHLDVVADPGHRADVVDRVVGWLQRPGTRLIDLDGLLATSELPGRLGAEILRRDVAPVVDLPSTADELLARLPGQLRNTIKRARKRLEKAGYEHRVAEPGEARRALAELARLHDARWSDDSVFLEAWSRFEAAAVAGIEAGRVQVHELVGPDGVVATELDLLAGDRMCFYQAGRSLEPEHRGAGSVLKFAAASDAIRLGLAEYDLLRGDESYKGQWATRRRDLVRAVASHGAVAAAVHRGGLAYIGVVGPILDQRAARRQARPDTPDGADTGNQMTTDDRISSEQRFHDERYSSEEERTSAFAYSITTSSATAYHDAVDRATGPTTRVLELGCGDHSQVWEHTTRDADVLAIDISQVAVDAARERAAEESLTGVEFRLMNAEELELEDSSFDVVIGSGILHHLDTPKAMAEVARVLRPGGRGVFLEPLGHNPILRAYRRVTPGDRTPDEHPLLRSDLDAMSEWFGDVDLEFFHLLSLAALPAIKTDAFDRMVVQLDRWDRKVLANSRRLQDQSWFVLIEVAEPKALKR